MRSPLLEGLGTTVRNVAVGVGLDVGDDGLGEVSTGRIEGDVVNEQVAEIAVDDLAGFVEVSCSDGREKSSCGLPVNDLLRLNRGVISPETLAAVFTISVVSASKAT